MSNHQTEQFLEAEKEAQEEYRHAMGLDCQDASRQYFLKQAKTKVNKKSGLYKLKVNQLKRIAQK
jgi:hypothetical protein